MQHPIRPLAAAIAVLASGALAAPAALAQSADGGPAALGEVVVRGQRELPVPAATSVGERDLRLLSPATSDTASLLRVVPGVQLPGAGGTSSLPVIRGLADDRNRILVDGMDLIASCPNHMNSPLSYLDPSGVRSLKVYAGITPVSVGGDSIGGTIIAEPRALPFIAPGQGLLATGEIGAYYRSNGDAWGANLWAALATDSFSIAYTGSTAQANNFKAGGNFKTTTATGNPGQSLALDEVGSTAYNTWSQQVAIGFKGGGNLVEAKYTVVKTPEELYPNQRMDMLDNEQQRFNLRYLGQFAWGNLDVRAYNETVDHTMNFGPDKQFRYGNAPGMPMNTHSRNTGATARADIILGENDLLRAGGLYQHYVLNDWWPPSGTGMMAPGTFENINDGRRDRLALFGEWESRLDTQWTTLLGARYERIVTDAGDVRGYDPTTNGGGMMGFNNQRSDAAAFNAQNHKRTDNNWNLTALARYSPAATADIEFGVARKVRSPNLYERYTWSTWPMAAIMNNTAGDGNGYYGNVALDPEKAQTVSATFDWHAADRAWEIKATPYYSRISDYVDAVRCRNATTCSPMTGNATTSNRFVILQYANQSAELYGIDISGQVPLAQTAAGDFGLRGLVGYVHGKNRDTGDGLYNIMPLNARVALTQRTGGWDNALELVAATAKDDLSAVRNEIGTPGYGITNLRLSYSWKQARIDFGIDNLFDKLFYQPLGGAYVGQGMTMSLNGVPWGIAVPGMGRSIYSGLSYRF